MSKVDFQVKWRERLLWLALRGLILDSDERARGPFNAGAMALTMPNKIEAMLEEIWNDIAPEKMK